MIFPLGTFFFFVFLVIFQPFFHFNFELWPKQSLEMGDLKSKVLYVDSIKTPWYSKVAEMQPKDAHIKISEPCQSLLYNNAVSKWLKFALKVGPNSGFLSL